jgi:hypothetical protein
MQLLRSGEAERRKCQLGKANMHASVEKPRVNRRVSVADGAAPILADAVSRSAIKLMES